MPAVAMVMPPAPLVEALPSLPLGLLPLGGQELLVRAQVAVLLLLRLIVPLREGGADEAESLLRVGTSVLGASTPLITVPAA